MQLKHIDLSELKVSKLNVRRHGAKENGDLIASIRSLGVLQPLLVKPNGDGFEIVAGQRRFLACKKLEAEGITAPLPCMVMEDGEDASVLEASLAENAVRLPLDEMDQFEAFAALQRKNMSVEDIASHFGVSERLIEKRLAIGNLVPQIRTLYRKGEIEPQTLRILTLASKEKQKEWLALCNDPEADAPPAWRLKEWLLGGAQISTEVALFDLADYPGEVVTDLFDDVSYFADAELFWQKQNEAIAAEMDKLRQSGWCDVQLIEPGTYFASWQYEQRSKKDGGKVFVEVHSDGRVTFHKGLISQREAAKADRTNGSDDAKSVKIHRPELSQPFMNYVHLHRHAAVRAKLTQANDIALRLAVAHMVSGSNLWRVTPEPCRPHNERVAESYAASPAHEPFIEARNEVRKLLDLTETQLPIADSGATMNILPSVFNRLLELEAADVLKILAYLMAETLELESPVLDDLGKMLDVNLADTWSGDDAFFALLKDRDAIDAILKEVAGKRVADGNLTATNKVKKGIIRDCLTGENERKKREGWIPKYLKFPFASYTDRGPDHS